MPTELGATDLNGAAMHLTSLLQAERSQPTEEQEAEPTEASEEPAEAEKVEAEESEPKYKVKVDGEELEVTLEELQKGYMMEANYRNKTSALAREREAVETKQAEIDQQLEEARSLLDDQIANLESKEMLELKEYDPESYLKEVDKIKAKTKKFEQLKAKRSQEHEKRMQKLVEKERASLLDYFPQWKNDSSAMQRESKQLIETMKSFGFTESELNSMTDHRMFVLAHKAQQLDAIQKADLKSKEVKSKPKTVKPGSAHTKDEVQADNKKSAWNTFKKTGSIKDAMNLF